MVFRPMGSVTRSIRTHDADEATAFMAGNIRSGLVRHVDPAGEINFRGDYYTDEDFAVGCVRVGAGLDFRPQAELDAIIVWLGLEGSVVVEHTGEQARVTADEILISSARSTRRVLIEQSYQGLVLGACVTDVKREMASFLGHDVDGPLDFITRVDARGRMGSGLLALASALQSGLSGDSMLLSSPIGIRRHKDAVLAMIMLAAGRDEVSDWGGPASLLSVQELRRADEFMRANADQPIGVGDVAQHLGVSVRKLQYTFRRHRDATPLTVLRRYRLAGVRHDLLAPDAVSIADVAAKWGFTNLGRFSRQYQIEFHERPSQTMARARHRRQSN